MQQLNSFCEKYLPIHFASKYRDCRLIKEFFDYKIEGNIYEITGKNIALLDILSSLNPELEASKIIQKNFIFHMIELKKYRNQSENMASQGEKGSDTHQIIQKILKSMNQKDRMCFQIFARLIYFYFETKNTKRNQNMRNESKEKKSDYFYQLQIFLTDVKFLAMTEKDSYSFNSSSFMEYCINVLLNLDPTLEFFSFVDKIMSEFQISPQSRDRTNYKIDQIKKNKLRKKIQQEKRNTKLEKQNSKSQPSNLEVTIQKQSQQKPPKANEQNQINPKNTNISELKTHETHQKKTYIENKRQDEPNSLSALKMTLQQHKKKSFNHRPVYSRKTYTISKKSSNMHQASPSPPKQSNNSKTQFQRDPYINYSDFQNKSEDEYFVDGGVLKPRKKVKVDESQGKMFDENGKFVPDQ